MSHDLPPQDLSQPLKETSTPAAPETPLHRRSADSVPGRWIVVGGAVAMLLIASSFFTESVLVATLADLPLPLLATVAFAVRMRRSRVPRIRAFWGLWALAMSSWTAAGLLNIVTPDLYKSGIPFNLATDLLYSATYLLVALSVEATPHRSESSSVAQSVRRARAGAAIVFVFGMIVYFALIPSTMGTWSYETWIPSLLLFVALDVYVLARFLRARHTCEERGWANVYGWLAGGIACWGAVDAWDLLAPLGAVPETPEVLWPVTFVPAMIVLLIGASRPTPDRERSHTRIDSSPPRWAGGLMAYAVAFPALHFLLHSFDVLDPELRAVREVWVLTILSLLVLLSWLYQQRIQAEVLRLVDRQRTLDQRLELTQRMEAVGRLAGGIAHDFNNTLQVIGTHADVLRRGMEDSEPQRAHADVIRRAVTRAGSLTDQLLTLSRKRRVEPEVFDLNDVPRNLATLASKMVGERATVAVEPDTAPIWIHADRAQLEHAVVNLLLNARDATPDNGRIVLRTTRGSGEDSSRGVLSVEDTGTGMEDGVRARIFEPFFTTKAGRGTGLGLSMVYGIVTQCGGEIHVETEPGGGSRFELSFPTCEAPPPALDTVQAALEADTQPGDSILVVEDELPILSVIAMHLRSRGFDVRTATDGESALEHIAERPVDLVLVDVVMPGMNGPALVERILAANPACRAIFMSGYADSVLQGLSGPVTDVPLLRKPFTTSQLDDAVALALEQPTNPLAAPSS